MKWYLHIVTKKDGKRAGFIYPYYGYLTKKEATRQAEEFKKQPGTVCVEVVKG